MKARKGMSDFAVLCVCIVTVAILYAFIGTVRDIFKSKNADPNLISRVERLEKRVDALENGAYHVREADKALAPVEGGEKR